MKTETDTEAKVLAHRFTQDGVTMYVTTLAAGIINRFGLVDTWKPYLEDLDPEQGYQRAVVTAHAKKIAKFLLNEDEERLMPTAVLLSSRKPLRFEPLEPGAGLGQNGGAIGWLTLEKPLYKVDGQHRTEGFSIAAEANPELEFFQLPTVIMESRDKKEEIEQFFTVNTTAKRVRTDLADRLLMAMGAFDEAPKGWRAKALEIVDSLNREADGPWRDRIKMPNSLTGIASQRTWTESLKPVLDGVLGDQPGETIAKALSNYWRALAKLMPEAFEEPKDYVIQKSTGVFSLNEVAAQVFKVAYQEGNDFSVDHLTEILERAFDSGKLEEQFWANTKNGGEAPMYAGRGGMATLAREILDAMPEGSVKINL